VYVFTKTSLVIKRIHDPVVLAEFSEISEIILQRSKDLRNFGDCRKRFPLAPLQVPASALSDEATNQVLRYGLKSASDPCRNILGHALMSAMHMACFGRFEADVN
jgi:hypothetical protein